MWYENPAFYALAVSLLSLFVSILALRNNKRATKQSIEQQISEHSIEINESFLRYDVKSPFAHHLKIPDKSAGKFTAKAVLLLHHINLLRTVFNNRDILGSTTRTSYENWATTIVRPWIESDEDLRRAWLLIKQSKNTNSKEFMTWLQQLFPILN